jgi:glycosyltransferase involved in cell wall biosynthesis
MNAIFSAPMRVGFGINLLARGLSTKQFDGIAVYTQALQAHLSELHDIQIKPLLFGSTWPSPENALIRTRYSAPSSMALSLITGRTPGVKHLDNELDLYHSTDHHILLSKKFPTVVTLHDVFPWSFPSPGMVARIKRDALAHGARRAQCIVTHSNFCAEEISKTLLINRGKIFVAPCGVDAEFFESFSELQKQEACHRYSLQPGFFLFIGTLQIRKNIVRILDAYSSLPHKIQNKRALVFIGSSKIGEESVSDAVEKASQEMNVRWLGRLNSLETRILLQSARALVFPSLYEGFGLPIIEAFASGTPVITSNTTSLPEVAGNCALLVDPYSIDEIANAMLMISSDEDMHKSLSLAGQNRSREFTWTRTAQLTHSVYLAAQQN